MTRMRKERTTMRIEFPLIDSQTSYDVWSSTQLGAPFAREGGLVRPILSPMPPIRCTTPVPCGVCWYCDQAEPKLNPLVSR